MKLSSLILLFVLGITMIPSQAISQTYQDLKGRVLSKESGEAIAFATVALKDVNKWTTTNFEGEFHIDKIKKGKYTLFVSCLGFQSIEKDIVIDKKLSELTFKLETLSLALNEIIITAKEKELGSSSCIGESAIQHLQAKSVEDILQLLPGHIVENPSLENPGQVLIREVGFMDNGQVNSGSDDNTSTLGAAVIVDGIPVSTNADMQVFSTAKNGIANEIPSVAGRGVDLREFTPDVIESVEVVRGIPSVEYGDLTSGAVIIKTKAGKTPYEMKMSIDPGTKMFYFGKGFLLRKKGIVNTSMDYTQYYSDIRKKYKGFKRITTNLGYSNTFFKSSKPLDFNFRLAFHSTLDDRKSDPQLKAKEVINSNKKGVRVGIKGKWYINTSWLTNLYYNFSFNYTHQDDYQKELHTITAGSMPLATSYKEGEYKANFLPAEYYSELKIDGKPYNLFAQVKGTKSYKKEEFYNKLMFGLELRSSGNNGDGREFDINFPPSINSISTTRPRSYKDIPSLTNLSVFLENKLIFPVGNTKFIGQVGVRISNTQPSGLFHTNGIISAEPRVNLKYQVLNENNNNLFDEFSIRFGFGKAAKTPTLLHLYPDKAYFDETSLNYKDETNIDGSLAVLTTKRIDDTSNPNLKPAINRKKEIGLDFVFKGIKAKLTAYHEKQTGGFRFKNVPVFFKHKEYQVDGGGKYPYFIEGDGVYYKENGVDMKANFTLDTSFHFYKTPVNDYVLIKKGIEYSFDFGKLKSLNTNFYLDGAYMSTESYNTEETISKKLTSYQGKAFPYLVVYPAGEKTIRQRFNTTLRLVNHIPELKLIFSLTTQVIWFEKRQYKYENNDNIPFVYVTKNNDKINVDDVYSYVGNNVLKNIAPLAYIDKTGNRHPFNSELYSVQPYYSMVKTYRDTYFLKESYPAVAQFNIKVTKEFSKKMSVAFSANNFLNIRPYQKLKRSTGYVRRNTPIYFGAELKMKF